MVHDRRELGAVWIEMARGVARGCAPAHGEPNAVDAVHVDGQARSHEGKRELDVLLGVVDPVVKLVGAEGDEHDPTAVHGVLCQRGVLEHVDGLFTVAVEERQHRRGRLHVRGNAENEALLPGLVRQVQRDLKHAAVHETA